MELSYDRHGTANAVATAVIGVVALGFGVLFHAAGIHSTRTPIPVPFLGIGAAFVIVGLLKLYWVQRPFRFVIDERGLTLRLPDHGKLPRFVPWQDIDVMLVEPGPSGVHRIVLVPADDAGIGALADTETSIEGRPGIMLVRLAELNESEYEVRQALQHYAGARYVDRTL